MLYSGLVMCTCVCYFIHPVRPNVHPYVRDPVRLRLRFLEDVDCRVPIIFAS